MNFADGHLGGALLVEEEGRRVAAGGRVDEMVVGGMEAAIDGAAVHLQKTDEAVRRSRCGDGRP